MITAVTIERRSGDGKYGDVLDAAEALAKRDYGSAANAIAVMVRQSPLFAEAHKLLNEHNAHCGASNTGE